MRRSLIRAAFDTVSPASAFSSRPPVPSLLKELGMKAALRMGDGDGSSYPYLCYTYIYVYEYIYMYLLVHSYLDIICKWDEYNICIVYK